MIQERFTTPEPVRLEIKVPAGDVEVATTDAGESTVTVEGSQKLLDATTVELAGGRLLIESRRKSVLDRGHRSLRVWVHVPRRSSVEIVGASVDATLDGTFAGLETKSASGSLRVAGEIAGDVTVKNVSGDVRLPRVGGDLQVRTVSGDILADSVDGSVSAKSVSGDVRVGLLREGTANVTSVSGDVEIGVASGTNVDVDATSASGDLSSEVPLSGVRSAEPGPTLVLRGKTVSGAVRLIRAR